MKQSRKDGTQNEKEKTFESRVTRLTIGLSAVLLVTSMAVISCAPKQVYIPVAERAALEKQQGQDAGSERLPSGSRREGMDSGNGITEQDISGRSGATHNEGELKAGMIKDIYFDFDSYALKSEDLPRLKDLAAWLRSNKRVSLKVEGHCDERGSIEYNLALGQKRAEVVGEYLVASGVDKNRIKTISYGKETPTDAGHSEEAWAKNRRAHLKIE